MNALWVLAGASAGFVFARWAQRRQDPPATRRAHATGLVVAAVVYAAAALVARVPVWIGLELLGVALFVGLAVAGSRRGAGLLALGWLIHVVWDVALHLAVSQPVVGSWYPSLCVGFDPVAAMGAASARFDRADTGLREPVDGPTGTRT